MAERKWVNGIKWMVINDNQTYGDYFCSIYKYQFTKRCISGTYMVSYTNLTSINKKECTIFLADANKQILKSMWKCKRPVTNKTVLTKNKVGGLSHRFQSILNIKLQLSRQCSTSMRDIGEQQRTQSPNINPVTMVNRLLSKAPREFFVKRRVM